MDSDAVALHISLPEELGRRNNEFYSLIDTAISYSQEDTTERKAVELLDSLKANFGDIDSTALGMLHYRYIYPLSLLGRHREGYRHYRKALAYWNGIEASGFARPVQQRHLQAPPWS